MAEIDVQISNPQINVQLTATGPAGVDGVDGVDGEVTNEELERLRSANVYAEELRGFRAGITNAYRGTAPFVTALLSHSIGEGWSSSGYADSWFGGIMAERFANLFGTSYGRGWVGATLSGAWTTSGSISQSSFGLSLHGAVIGVGAYIEKTVTCDRVVVTGIQQNFLRGAVTISIDGVDVGTYQSYDGALGASAYGDPWQYDSGAITRASHTVRIRQVTGSGGAYAGLVDGAMFFDGNYDTTQFWNGSHFGYNTSHYDTPSTSTESWAASLDYISPDLVIIEHGVNDYGSGTVADSQNYQSRLSDIVDYVRSKADPDKQPSILLCVDLLVAARTDANWAKFVQVVYDVAEDKGCAVFDMYALTGNIGNATDDIYDLINTGDYTHPNNKGHHVIGTGISDFLLAFAQAGGTGGGSGDVTGPGSSTDDAVVLWDGTDGTTIKNSTVTIDSSGNIVTTGTIGSGNITLTKETAGTIKVGTTTTAATAGGALTLSGGDGNSGVGGQVKIQGGTGLVSAFGGKATVQGGTGNGFAGGDAELIGGGGFGGGNAVVYAGSAFGVYGLVNIAGPGGRVNIGSTSSATSKLFVRNTDTTTDIVLRVRGMASQTGDLLRLETSTPTTMFSVDINGVILSGDGSASTPGNSFVSDPDSGMYRIGANNIGFAVNGALRFDISTSALTSTLPLALPNGSQSAPSLHFGDSDTGFYSETAGEVKITTNGGFKWKIDATGDFFPNSSLTTSIGTTSAGVKIFARAGTAANPTLAFTDTDNGYYLIGADNIGLSIGGTLRADWSTTRLLFRDGFNIQLGTTTGTKIGTATSQKIGFFNATPVIQQTGDVKTALQTLGLVASASYPTADTSTVGDVELATIAETNTGTDATRAVTPDGLAGSNLGAKEVSVPVVAAGTALTTGDGKAYFRIPSSLNGMNLIMAAAAVTTTSSSGLPTVQIARGRQASPTSAHSYTDMLTTKVTIDVSEYDSKDATTALVIDTANDDVATGDLIRIDVDTAGTGTAGLYVTLIFQLP